MVFDAARRRDGSSGDDITQPREDHDPRTARARTLSAALKAHGFEPETSGCEVWLPGAPPLIVRCEHRVSDAGRLWFVTGSGEPLAPADAAHMHEAITAVKGKVSPPKQVMT